MRQSLVVALPVAFVALAMSASLAISQQQPSLRGTVTPTAPGFPMEPVPIGGLRTRPLTVSGSSDRSARTRPQGVVLLRIADAPLSRAGIALSGRDAMVREKRSLPLAAWTPTAERPRWVRDASVRPVDAWRDLIVTDVVCDPAGDCRERQQRLRARWIAGCRCYAFADGWGRIWRVE
ncbi:MAG: hypothetical protein ABMA00_05370 [Gemmatimonas sp.]